jgi:predicted nucleic acid-binding protein
VLDSSVALAWFFADEGEVALAVLDRVGEAGAVVPPLWRYEVANGLLVAQRRGRIDAEYRARSLGRLAVLAIACDEESDRRCWDATVALAETHGLTAYDAAYLELAHRRRLPLATLDAALARAARAAEVELMPL